MGPFIFFDSGYGTAQSTTWAHHHSEEVSNLFAETKKIANNQIPDVLLINELLINGQSIY